MKSHKLITSFATLALIGGIGMGAARAEDEAAEKAEQTKLMAEAKVTKDEAQAIVLKEIPNGTVKEGEIEMEKGTLIWSFDLTTPGTTDTTEVNVDAKTGKLIGVEHEKDEKEDNEKGEKDEKEGDDKD